MWNISCKTKKGNENRASNWKSDLFKRRYQEDFRSYSFVKLKTFISKSVRHHGSIMTSASSHQTSGSQAISTSLKLRPSVGFLPMSRCCWKQGGETSSISRSISAKAVFSELAWSNCWKETKLAWKQSIMFNSFWPACFFSCSVLVFSLWLTRVIHICNLTTQSADGTTRHSPWGSDTSNQEVKPLKPFPLVFWHFFRECKVT